MKSIYLLILCCVSAHSQIENFSEFRILAKHTITEQAVLMTAHFIFASYDGDEPSPLQLNGAMPPHIHQHSIQATGQSPLLVVRFYRYTSSIAFYIRTTSASASQAEIQIQSLGYGEIFLSVTGLTQGGWKHVELSGLESTDGIAIYGNVSVTNIEIQ